MILVLLSLAAAPAAARRPPKETRITPVVRAYNKARPAVVNISARRIVQARTGLFGGGLFEELFPDPFTRNVPVSSLGSGFVIHEDGYVVTNAHVVQRAESITVQTHDDSKHPARVLSADSSHDLAVLKLDLPEGVKLPALPLGRSDDLMVGETVIAVGNPFGLSNTVSRGIVSALGRQLQIDRNRRLAGLIQTDAPINPGNSGGPVLNINGEVIGVSTAIRADAQSIGFAIPVDRLWELLPHMVDYERINRVILGVKVAHKHLASETAVLVDSVAAGTPAEGKLSKGDRLLALDGRPVAEMADFVCGMLAAAAERPVRIRYERNGRQAEVTLRLKVRPKPDGAKLAEKLLGLTVREITPQLRRDLGLSVGRGLLVVGVRGGGPADRIGIRLKDVIFQLGRLYVKDLDSLGAVLEEVEAGDRLLLGLARGNVRAWVELATEKP